MSRSHVLLLLVGMAVVAGLMPLCAAAPLPSHGGAEPEGGSTPLRVAVVGGGAGGAGMVQALRRYFPRNQVEVDVYDKAGTLGGRAQATAGVEMGASFFIDQNRYVRDMADATNTTRSRLPATKTAVWDGNGLVFQETDYTVLNAVTALWRYGLDLYTLKTWARGFVRAFDDVYALQGDGRAFGTPEELWGALGLYNFSQHSFEAVVGAPLLRSTLGREVITGVLHNIYNQGLDVNALSAALAMAPLSVGASAVWVAQGGNGAMYHKFIHDNADRVFTNAVVTAVNDDDDDGDDSPHGGVRRSLDVVDATTGQLRDTPHAYDVVVVAVPLEIANVALNVAGAVTLAKRSYVTTHVTLVTGVLNTAFFGANLDDTIGDVLSADNASLPFTGFVTAVPPDARTGVRKVKIQSRAAIANDTDLLSAMFSSIESVDSVVFQAYPAFKAPERFAPFEVAPAVYYPSAVENGCSAMEVMAMASHNVALMMHNRFIAGTTPLATEAGVEADTHTEL